MRRKRPQIAERVLHGSGAVAIGRILEPANGGGAGADSRRVQVVRVGYVHVQQEWSGLRFFACFTARQDGIAHAQPDMPRDALRILGRKYLASGEGLLQELPLGSFTVPWRSP